jgi:hypothetical protein
MKDQDPTAESRSGWLLDPGPEQPHPDLEQAFTDGTSLRVVRWSLLTERPCLVRCPSGERNLQRIRKLSALCGEPCEDAVATSGMPTGDRAGYCNTCLSLAGRGMLK